MITELDLIRKALKGARRLAYGYRYGGLQGLLRDVQGALTALDSLEKRDKSRQLSLWQGEVTTQQLGDNNG